MAQSLLAEQINLRFLIDNFDIKLVEDKSFFLEWQENLPEISELDKQLLDRVKAGFINLLNYPPMLEGIVRMAVLDPILFIAEFYLNPFYVKSEKSVEIVTKDEGIVIKGRMDTLVLKDQFWVMVIESKKATFSIEEGLPQILAYMLCNPLQNQPGYGMIATGGTFVFIKLVINEQPKYATSSVFATRNDGDLYNVLRILKRLSQIAISNIK